MIIFTRIDDRVIHGQTLVCWLSDYPCEGILIIDDDLAKDAVMAEIYKGAVPSNIRVYVFDVATAQIKLSEAHASAKRYFVIFKSVLTCLKVLDVIVPLIKVVNVGPASKRPDTKEIVPTIALDKQEIEAYREIHQTGIKIFFQIIPTQKKVFWNEIDKSITG
ncbi:MAG: PTS sugar transporter subunit IIB [Chloroflexi bacterium]|nr:PTS sugar transporter subunit IIB [Chloroflexota bacterium]